VRHVILEELAMSDLPDDRRLRWAAVLPDKSLRKRCNVEGGYFWL